MALYIPTLLIHKLWTEDTARVFYIKAAGSCKVADCRPRCLAKIASQLALALILLFTNRLTRRRARRDIKKVGLGGTVLRHEINHS